MSEQSWRAIWSAKRGTDVGPSACDGEVAVDDERTLVELLTLNGYHTPTATVSPGAWREYVLGLAERHGLRPGARVFEVGCGAGAFLYPLARAGFVTDGLDFAPGLIEAARRALPEAQLTLSEASALEPTPTYDLVVSSGVFLYFPSAEYAGDVLRKMIAKSTGSVWVLDINDADLKDEALALRRASYPPGEYDRAYAGLDQLYLSRGWFEALAAEHGLTCAFEAQSLPGYVSARYRFHALLSRA